MDKKGGYMEVKLLRVEKFSNKNFFIEIELYEHNLAKGRCEVKREGKRRQKNWWKSPITSPLLYFPSYHWISIAEWEEFYENFRHDKTARRWVRRVMRHSFDGFLSPDGRIDHTKFAIENDRREHRSREYYRMNKEELMLMKKLLPGFFAAGTFRTGVYEYTPEVVEVSSKEEYKSIPPRILNNPLSFRKFLQGKIKGFKRYLNVELFKEFIKVFDPAFYEQVCRERTMNNCNIELEYRFPQGEIPEMRIFVQDNEFIDYRIPGY